MAGKYDDMTFKKAFVAARKAKGAGKVFTYKGKRYTTNLKEEEKKITRRKSGAPKKSLKPKKRPGSGSVAVEKITVTKLPPAFTIPTKGAQAKMSIGQREALSKKIDRIEKKMRKDFKDSPSLVDDILRAIKNFRRKNPSASQVKKEKSRFKS